MLTLRTAYRTCPFCEATCGLAVTLDDDDAVVAVRGDADDVLSQGFLCPKGVAIGALQEDPDRLRAPLVDGLQADWEDAFAAVRERLAPIQAKYGRDSVAIYLGNPSAHSLGAMLYSKALIKAVGTKNVYSASSVDQLPKHVSAGLMFGSPVAIPVPDVERANFLLMLGANPLASNGSLLTAPDMRGKLRAIVKRGGQVVVVDPRRTRTADLATGHLAILPGTDALLLMALVHTLFDEDLTADLDPARYAGVDELKAAAAGFAPEAVAGACGVQADEIRALARSLAAAAPASAVYGRIGTCTQAFGTMNSWLVDALNALIGSLDQPGGAMWPAPATGGGAFGASAAGGARRAWRPGRWSSRVRGLPEAIGELPVATLADEIETPGDGQIRALITVAGNPARSTPNSARMEAALASLELMVSVDIYRNETTRHADVVLPVPAPLEKSHYDVALYGFACRNVANYSAPVLERPAGMPQEWETLLRLAAIAVGAREDVEQWDAMVAGEVARKAGLEPAPDLVGPERILDLLLRAGPYDVDLQALLDSPHGIDFGPLTASFESVVRTIDGRADLAPGLLIADVDRLRARLADGADSLLLIGRRHLRSNNSWMHNLPKLVSGPVRCTLQLHPDDAAALGVVDGSYARVASRVGEVVALAEVTDTIRPGVVSIPHGWGHDGDGLALSVAAANAGVNANALVDEEQIDPVSGNAVLNGVPVSVVPVLTAVAA